MGILNATTSCLELCDDLLDFTLDDENTVSTDTAAFRRGTRGGSFPPDLSAEEEELEWLSNKDTFPSVETCFGILSDNPELVCIHHNSPVSVLENPNANSNSGSGSALVVPTNFHVRARRSRMRRKRRANYGKLFENKQEYSSTFELPPVPTSGAASLGRRCLHCQVDTTPQWRAGPLGPKTLCNACGVRFKSGRLLPEYRPASSPTFSSTLHSNSHRKVVEMRKQKQVATGGGV